MESKSLLISLTDILKKEKVLFGIIVVAVIAVIIYFVLGRPQKSSGDYLTDTVKRGNITSSVSASGTVEPVDTVSLSFKDAEIVNMIMPKSLWPVVRLYFSPGLVRFRPDQAGFCQCRSQVKTGPGILRRT